MRILRIIISHLICLSSKSVTSFEFYKKLGSGKWEDVIVAKKMVLENIENYNKSLKEL